MLSFTFGNNNVTMGSVGSITKEFSPLINVTILIELNIMFYILAPTEELADFRTWTWVAVQSSKYILFLYVRCIESSD